MKIIKQSQDDQKRPVTLREAMNRLFEESFWDPFGSFLDVAHFHKTPAAFHKFIPSIDVSEDKKSIKIEANIPGYDPKNIEIDLSENILNIKGKTGEQKTEEGKKYFIQERSSGEFSRQISLPQNMDIDHAVCKAKNGMLTIIIPKKEPQPPRKSIKVDIE